MDATWSIRLPVQRFPKASFFSQDCTASDAVLTQSDTHASESVLHSETKVSIFLKACFGPVERAQYRLKRGPVDAGVDAGPPEGLAAGYFDLDIGRSPGC